MARKNNNLIGKIDFYFRSSNLHGLRYIVDGNKHPIIRFLWICIFTISLCGMLRIFKGSYRSYKENAISFATETTYLDWNTTFPAISICEVATTEMFWTNEPNAEFYSSMHQFLNDIIFFTGNCYSCSTADTCKHCGEINYKEILTKFRKKCTKLLSKCKWNEKQFNCCDEFLPLNTEYGICFAINSLHTNNLKGNSLKLQSNRKTGPGQLEIEAIDDIRLYIHAPEDIPFINSDTDLRKEIVIGETHKVELNIIEIFNDENVKSVSADIRGCRFPEETYPELQVHQLYSYSTCVVQCHADAHLNLCNCTHHLMPVLGDEDYCNITGLLCLSNHFETVNRLHAKGSDKPGLVCECVPSCSESEYKIVTESKKTISTKRSKVTLKLNSLPTLRFKRNVVRTTMDLVVSIGGTAGLFIGASLLSIVEMVYLLVLRRK